MTAPLRVLHYNTASGWRGGEQQVRYLAEALGRFPVVQFAAGQPGEAFLERLTPHVHAVFGLGSKGEWSPGAVFGLIRLIHENRIDIVHTHSTPGHALGLQAKMLFPGFKLIVHRRVDFRIKNNPLSLLKYKSNRVDRIICISEFIRNLLVNQSIPPEKLAVIHSGVDPARLVVPPRSELATLRKSLGISPRTVVLGNIAALTAHKDHLTLVESMRFLSNMGVDFKLLILGEGEQRGAVEAAVRDSGLQDRITLLGFQKNVGPYLGIFDVMVHSSRDEGLGTTILDALAQSVPVVATDAGGIPEILGRSEFGVVTPRRDPRRLAEAVVALIGDAALMKRYRNSGPTRVKAFSVNAMAESTFALYREITKGPRPS